LKRLVLRTLLFGLTFLLRLAARVDAGFRADLRRHDAVAQIRVKDGSLGRWHSIAGGRIRSGAAGCRPPANERAPRHFGGLRTGD
jgi:trimethylamine-N-oxide reductase (cytochrome c)